MKVTKHKIKPFKIRNSCWKIIKTWASERKTIKCLASEFERETKKAHSVRNNVN